MPERRPVGLRSACATPRRRDAGRGTTERPWPEGAPKLDDDAGGRPAAGAPGARPQGLVRQAARRSPARSTTPARRCSSCRAAGRAGVGPRDAGRARVAPAAVRGQGRRGDDDGACPRTTSRRSTRSRPSRASSTTSTTRSSSGPGCGRAWRRPSSSACCSRRPATTRAADRPRRRGAPLAGHDGRLVGGRPRGRPS